MSQSISTKVDRAVKRSENPDVLVVCSVVVLACSKLKAMAIYLVKQACGNNKLACVYVG